MNRFIHIVALAAVAMGLMAGGAANAASPAECDAYATSYADQNTNAAAETLGSGFIGGAGAALMCGIFGVKNVGDCAAVGAGAGLTIGAIRSSERWRTLYENAYNQCVSQPIYYPPAGSDAWRQMCAAKYRSFDWYSGYFMGFDRQWHYCKIP